MLFATHNIEIGMKKKETHRTKRVPVRLTMAEYIEVKKRADESFGGCLSCFVRAAIGRFDDKAYAHNFDVACAVGKHYEHYTSEIRHLGINLNQLAHQANLQLESAGQYASLYDKKVLPAIEELRNLLSEIRSYDRDFVKFILRSQRH